MKLFKKPAREIREVSYKEALELRRMKQKPAGLPRPLWRNATVRGKLPCAGCGRWFKDRHLNDGKCNDCKRQETQQNQEATA